MAGEQAVFYKAAGLCLTNRKALPQEKPVKAGGLNRMLASLLRVGESRAAKNRLFFLPRIQRVAADQSSSESQGEKRKEGRIIQKAAVLPGLQLQLTKHPPHLVEGGFPWAPLPPPRVSKASLETAEIGGKEGRRDKWVVKKKKKKSCRRIPVNTLV